MSSPPNPAALPPREAAAYWLSRKRSGDMTVDEARALEVWLERDVTHAAAFTDFERLWDTAEDVADDPAIIAARETAAMSFNRPARALWAGAIAASLAVASLTGWMAVRSGVLHDLGVFNPPPVQVLRTSVGQRTTITLSDRSVVTLDTDTVLRLHEFRHERRIELERGRAFFRVAKDKSRPFLVLAAGKTVRATGTAFDVRVDPERMEVTLVDGRVRIESPADDRGKQQKADMRAGWRITINDDPHWKMSPVDLRRETSWHDGRLSFFRDPLAEAAAEMNRYSEKKIVFRGKAPDVPVIGTFRAGDVDAFAMAVELNKLARVTGRTEDTIELSGK